MGDEIACVVTNGGPLIVLPYELADAWRGTNDVDGEASDYDRACDEPARTFSLHDSFSAWPVSVGDGTALVLDGECSTTALRWDCGLVIVRDVGQASEAEVLAMIAAVADRDWVDCRFVMVLGRGLFVFDSAYAGDERNDADGGIIEAEVVPGRYRLEVAYPGASGRTTLLRLVGPRQIARGNEGIVVR